MLLSIDLTLQLPSRRGLASSASTMILQVPTESSWRSGALTQPLVSGLKCAGRKRYSYCHLQGLSSKSPGVKATDQGAGRVGCKKSSPSSDSKNQLIPEAALVPGLLEDPPQAWEPVMFSCEVVASSIITLFYWYSFLLCSFSFPSRMLLSLPFLVKA